jgi:hypothetical protein
MARSRTASRRRTHVRPRARRRWERKRPPALRTRRRRLQRHRRRALLRRRRWAQAPWWDRYPLEWLALESGFPDEYSGFRRHEIGQAFVYTGDVDVGDAGTRRLALIFPGRPSRVPPIVMADGPRKSRHRYRWARPTSLCIWYPRDPPPQRWSIDEGLHGLIDRSRVHLLKEAWWRAERAWDSPEIHRDPHGTERRVSSSDGRRRQRLARQRCWCGAARYLVCHGAIDADQELRQLGLVPPPADRYPAERATP